MAGHFKLKNKIKLSDLTSDQILPESDFATLTPDGLFVQLEYQEGEDKVTPFEVKPGLYTIEKTIAGLYLVPTSFVKDKILEGFVQTENITTRIDKFFEKLHVYEKHGIEIPKRAMLLYGPAGTGKTTSIIKAVTKYLSDNETLAVIWPTDKFEAYTVKDFVKSFEYTKHNVKRLILVVEDIGGVEIDNVRMKSDSSLLSLLDNQEKTFKNPTFIIATTNHPDIFLGNLTNRPGRFNDKIEVGYPGKEFRVALFDFYAKENVNDEARELIASSKCKEFTADHIREVVIRADLYDKTLKDTVLEIVTEIEAYKDAFQKKNRMGLD